MRHGPWRCGRGGASTPDQHAPCMTTWSAHFSHTTCMHTITTLGCEEVGTCVALCAPTPVPQQCHPPPLALVSPVHCHSAVHSAPLAVCRQQHTTGSLTSYKDSCTPTTDTPHHTRGQWTVLRLLLFTSHHSRPLTMQTVHLLLQPLQDHTTLHGMTMDTKHLQGRQRL